MGLCAQVDRGVGWGCLRELGWRLGGEGWGKEGVLFQDSGDRGAETAGWPPFLSTFPRSNYTIHSVRGCVSEMVFVVLLLGHVRLCDLIDYSQSGGTGGHVLLQGIFLTRDRTCVSYVFCISRWLLYH